MFYSFNFFLKFFWDILKNLIFLLKKKIGNLLKKIYIKLIINN